MMKFFVALLLMVSSLKAFETSPWIDRALVPVASLDVYGEHFDKIGNCPYNNWGLFIDGSLQAAISSDLEFGVSTWITQNKAHSLAFDSFHERIKTVFFDDARGDDFALSFALQFGQILEVGLHDPSLFHHGLYDIEFAFAGGKEWSCEEDWVSRIWGNIVFGLANQGSPWFRGTFAFRQCFCDHCFEFSVIPQCGLGRRKFHLRHFDGYGLIAYRAIDLSLDYIFQTDDGIELRAGLLGRALSRNAPKNLWRLGFEIIYPFGL